MDIMKIFILLASLCVCFALKREKNGTSARYEKRTATCLGICSPLCNDGKCIYHDWICDLVPDCSSGEDEVNCPTDCSGQNQFQCANGNCVSTARRCDGGNNCGDNSDEQGCDKAQCVIGKLKCPTSFRCIYDEWKCDGEIDCGPGDDWDERDCP